MSILRTCIIGAGASGLAAAKHLLARGHSIEVFERSTHIGGVWAPWRAYPGLHTQTPRDQFSFSDYPMREELPDWPPAKAVHEHLIDYAEHFGIRPFVKLETEVLRLSPLEGGRWLLACRHGGVLQTQTFDYVVIASGLFDKPFVPELSGRADFEASGGNVVHSLHCIDPQLLTNRNVVVLGFQKTAMDIAAFAAAQGSKVGMVYRQSNWKLPRYLGGYVNVRELFFSRLAEMIGRCAASLPNPTAIQRFLHKLGRPLTSSVHATLQGLVRRQLRLDQFGLVPDQGFSHQIHCGVSLASPGFFEHVHQENIRCERGRIACLEAGHVRLEDGRRLPADLLVLATGFDMQLPYLDADIRDQVFDVEGLLGLYRNILPPTLPTLGFCGFNSSFASPITAEVGAAWLAELWSGAFATPNAAEMSVEVERDLEWRLKHWPDETRSLHNACVGANLHHYLDCLLRDMGCPVRRSGLRALLQPLQPGDYRDLLPRPTAVTAQARSAMLSGSCAEHCSSPV